MAKIKKQVKTAKPSPTKKTTAKQVKLAKPGKAPAHKQESAPPTKEAVATVVKVKQTTAAISKIIKGIDNEAVSVKKAHEALNKKIDKINASVNVANKLLSGLSDISVASLPKALSKPVTKPVSKPTPKFEKPAKTDAETVRLPHAPATQQAPMAAPSSTTQSASASSNGTRIPLKSAIDDIIKSSDKSLSAANIYSGVTSKHGQWSRQSLYNALKDDARYVKNGDGANASYTLKGASVSGVSRSTEEEADALIQKMTDNSAPLANLI